MCVMCCSVSFRFLETFKFLGVLNYEGQQKQKHGRRNKGMSVFETFNLFGVLNYERTGNTWNKHNSVFVVFVLSFFCV